MARATILEFHAPVGGVLDHIAPQDTWVWTPQDPTIPGDPQSLMRFQAVDRTASLGIPDSGRSVKCHRLGPMGQDAIRAWHERKVVPDKRYVKILGLTEARKITLTKPGEVGALSYCELRFPLAESPDPLAELQALAEADFGEVLPFPAAGTMLLTGGEAKPAGLIEMLDVKIARTPEGKQVITFIGAGTELPPP